MESKINLRELQPTDGPDINLLHSQTPDTGAVAFHTQFHHDPYTTLTLLHPHMRGVVAEAEGHEGLVGMGLVNFGECQFQGDVYPSAYLNSLSVHPDFRRMGIATRLAQWRVEAARDHFTQQVTDGVIYAGIQGGNTGSISTAAKWSTQRLDDVNRLGIAKVRTKRPRPVDDLRVRRATPNDLEEIAHKQNGFYRDYNFYPPQTAAGLHDWLSLKAF